MIHLLEKDYYGLLMLFLDAVRKDLFLNEFAYLSTICLTSLLILLCSATRKLWYAHGGAGITGSLVLCGAAAFQLLCPVDAGWQKQVFLPQVLNPVMRLFQTPVFIRGTVHVTFWQAFLGIWAVGGAFQLCRLLNGRRRMARLVRELPKSQLDIPDPVRGCVPRNTKLYRCSGISVPLSIGILHRTILVPDQVYTEAELCDILRHEGAHLKHLDTLAAFLTDCLCAAYWWNPCVYILRRDIERNLELRCDAVAVRGMDNLQMAAYMETLLKVFQGRHGRVCQGGLGMLGSGEHLRRQMRERFAVLERKSAGYVSAEWQGMVANVTIAVLFFALSYCVVYVPYFAPTPDMLEPGPGASEAPMEAYYVVAEEAYIVNYGDKRYVLYTPQGEIELPKEEAELLEADGTEIRYVLE